MTDASADKLAGPTLRKLKGLAQLLPATLMVGKLGLTADFYRSLHAELERKELVKVKFTAFKSEKKELVKELVANSAAQLVMRVGNVAVLYRQNPDERKRAIQV